MTTFTEDLFAPVGEVGVDYKKISTFSRSLSMNSAILSNNGDIVATTTDSLVASHPSGIPHLSPPDIWFTTTKIASPFVSQEIKTKPSIRTDSTSLVEQEKPVCRTVAGKPVSSSIKDTSYRSNLEPAYSKVQEQNLTIASLQRRLCAVEHELSSIDELVSSVSHISLEHLSPDTDRIYTQSFDMKTGKGRSATPKPVFKKVEEVMGHFAEQLVQSTWNIKEQSESVIEIEEENVALKEENRKLEEENIWLEGKIEMLVKRCRQLKRMDKESTMIISALRERNIELKSEAQYERAAKGSAQKTLVVDCIAGCQSLKSIHR